LELMVPPAWIAATAFMATNVDELFLQTL
jgi:hypothetical protein